MNVLEYESERLISYDRICSVPWYSVNVSYHIYVPESGLREVMNIEDQKD